MYIYIYMYVYLLKVVMPLKFHHSWNNGNLNLHQPILSTLRPCNCLFQVNMTSEMPAHAHTQTYTHTHTHTQTRTICRLSLHRGCQHAHTHSHTHTHKHTHTRTHTRTHPYTHTYANMPACMLPTRPFSWNTATTPTLNSSTLPTNWSNTFNQLPNPNVLFYRLWWHQRCLHVCSQHSDILTSIQTYIHASIPGCSHIRCIYIPGYPGYSDIGYAQMHAPNTQTYFHTHIHTYKYLYILYFC